MTTAGSTTPSGCSSRSTRTSAPRCSGRRDRALRQAELALSPGADVDAAGGYRDAVALLEAPSGPRSSAPPSYGPWVIFPGGRALRPRAQASWTRRRRAAARPRCKVPGSTAVGFLDYPVTGTVLFALGPGELVADPSPTLRSAPYACWSSPTCSPTTGRCPAWAGRCRARLVEQRSPGLLEQVRREYAGRNAPELRDEAERLVAELPQ